MVAARGIPVDFLQKDEIRIYCFQLGGKCFQILLNLLFCLGTDPLAAIHKKVSAAAQSAVADIPAQNCKLFR